MTHDNTGPVISKFKSIGATRIMYPSQLVFTLDHDVQNKTAKNLSKYASIEAFARKHGVDFYPAGRGIGHQVLVEEGYAFPHTLTVASDSHSNMYGGVGGVGTPIVRTDAAALWATGKTWWQVPRMIKVEFKGKLAPGLPERMSLWRYAALSTMTRLTISNMTTEWGALAGVFPVDEVTLDCVPRLRPLYARPPRLRPQQRQGVHPCRALEDAHIPIQKAYLLSCTNARLSDIAAAAAVMKGHSVAPGVQFYVAAASSEVQQDAERTGDWETLVAAGAKPLPAGCGPCIGLGTGLLEEGETGISATNRNYKGRMGHPKALAYLASPAVVAASAIKGYICGPDSLDPALLPPSGAPTFSIETPSVATSSATPAQAEAALEGFPSTFTGPLLFAPQDNLNTDALYPGKYTYQDDITLERQAEVEQPASTDPATKRGIVLVSGYNFGTGSSREQAATALKAAGVPLVIAGSFGDIFKRNAINNGLVCIECPALVADLTKEYAKDEKRGAGGKDGELTVNKGISIDVRVVEGRVEATWPNGERRTYTVGPVGASVQELWICGGLEGYVLKSIQAEKA
ncbi:Homoaconitase, mitochondrial [Grifola frondosa]|uniref:Homoaconitase, mitochondrial n=1 Tax=Grifola frondosa TaxID=5627 RepID=A0A1C7MCH0_GRIFR|nr:Homoaconitase, mitochondrial [Grifola frondosa]